MYNYVVDKHIYAYYNARVFRTTEKQEGRIMKKTVFALLCTVLVLWASVSSACTSIIVGKDASADGSLLVGRN